MQILYIYLITLVFFLIIDFLWLGKIMSRFYVDQLSHLGKIENGEFKPILWAAFLVYVLIPLGIVIFVLPKALGGSILSAAGWGAVYGAILYGVYDFTNYSLIKDYPQKMVWADVAWGTFLCMVTSVFAFIIKTNFFTLQSV